MSAAAEPDDFADGLLLNRLQPASIIAFLLGVPRRVDERLIAATPASDDEPPPDASSAINAMHDSLARAALRLKQGGYAADHAIADQAQPAIATDPQLSRLHAATLEVARRVAGVPDSAWSEQDDLLDSVRRTCAEVAEQLRSIGSDVTDE